MNWSVEASPLGPTIEPEDAVEEAMEDFQQGNHGEFSVHAHAWALENAELVHNMQLLFGCPYKLTCGLGHPAGPNCNATTMKSVASDLVECLERIEKHEAAEPHWRMRRKKGSHEPRALEPDGECEYVLSESYANTRVWIGIKEPSGARSADVGIMFNEDGVSIDVWNGSDEGSEQVIQPWLLWDDLESREGRPEREEEK